jgi:carbon-monoxide dehydrogenase large subunit
MDDAKSAIRGIGEEVRRKEDLRLVTGTGCYADDIPAKNPLYAIFVHSPHAHARIKSINVTEARKTPGVVDVLTGKDALADGLKPVPHSTGNSFTGTDVPLKNINGTERLVVPHPAFASDIVRTTGEVIAVALGDTIWAARDAAEKVQVEWEQLPVVTRSFEAVKKDAPLLWDAIPGNVSLDAEVGDKDGTEKAFAKAKHIVSFNTWINRVTGVHMEPRAALAEYDAKNDSLTLNASLGMGVIIFRQEIAGALGMELEKVRIKAPQDVGGNFGTRNATNPEYVIICWAARKYNRPVKHVCDRTEAFLTDYQGRDLYTETELALDENGKFLAIRSTNLSNIGAHTTSFVALNKGVQLMSSVYDVPVAYVRGKAVLTNTPSTIPYRSAGRPEVIYVIERMIDIAAKECGFDRVQLRRKNLIRPKQQPYTNPIGIKYDNGDYEATMNTALELGEWKGFEKRRKDAAKRGKLRGMAVANYVETTSGFPRERADVTVLPEGKVDVIIGTQATGQGHQTSFSQLICEFLGVAYDDVNVRYGDTAFVKAGGGSHSGRSMRFGSVVIYESALEIIEKGKKIAGVLMEADAGDVEFKAGRFGIKGTDRSLGLFEVAAAAQTTKVPKELRGPLAAFCDKTTIGLAYPYGSHACEVEIDPDTGVLEIVRYVAVDDVGRAVNPMILHGQTQGGIVTGLGQALMEQCYYDPKDGQLLSASFMDYAMPRADNFPMFTTALSEVPSVNHPLGFRPGGEGGTTPALGCMVNAICDALKDYGVRHIDMPVTSQKIWKAMRGA